VGIKKGYPRQVGCKKKYTYAEWEKTILEKKSKKSIPTESGHWKNEKTHAKWVSKKDTHAK